MGQESNPEYTLRFLYGEVLMQPKGFELLPDDFSIHKKDLLDPNLRWVDFSYHTSPLDKGPNGRPFRNPLSSIIDLTTSG